MSKKTKKYFTQSLNYTLANEDTLLELDLLPNGVGHVLSVAGSGGRVLPLLAKNPKNITCVDLSQEQLYLTELRIESVRALTREEFLAFWGYPPRSATPSERRSIFNKIKISESAKKFIKGLFDHLEWKSILYEGKWERTFIKLSQVNRLLTGVRGLELFSALNEKEQKEYLENKFPRKAWGMVLALVGNAGVFNTLLYKGAFPRKNIPKSFYTLYKQTFDRLFLSGLARQNFFLQLVFFGRVIFEDGLPIECRTDIFEAAKKSVIKTKISYVHSDLIQAVEKSEMPIDFVSLSDVPSYFSGELEKNFMSRMSKNIAPHGIAVLRNYLHVPEDLDISDYEKVTGQYQDQILSEKVGVYQIEVYRRRA